MREKKGAGHELEIFIYIFAPGLHKYYGQVCLSYLKVYYKISHSLLYIVKGSINEEIRKIMPSKWSQANREGL